MEELEFRCTLQSQANCKSLGIGFGGCHWQCLAPSQYLWSQLGIIVMTGVPYTRYYDGCPISFSSCFSSYPPQTANGDLRLLASRTLIGTSLKQKSCLRWPFASLVPPYDTRSRGPSCRSTRRATLSAQTQAARSRTTRCGVASPGSVGLQLYP